MPNITAINKIEIGFLNNFFGKIGFLNENFCFKNKKKILFILETDDFNFKNIFDIIIYQGVHLDKLFFKSDLILPATAIFEYNSLFLNFFNEYYSSNFLLNNKKNNMCITPFLFFNSFLSFFYNYIFSKLNFNVVNKNINFRSYLKIFLIKNIIKNILGLSFFFLPKNIYR